MTNFLMHFFLLKRFPNNFLKILKIKKLCLQNLHNKVENNNGPSKFESFHKMERNDV